MNIMFVAPRFHTNQFSISKNLIEAGHKVDYYVQTIGVSEDHTYVKPVKMKLSLIGRIISNHVYKKYDKATAETIMLGKFIPSFFDAYRHIKRFKPDLVILRDRTPSTLVANMACKLLGIKSVILYNLTPLHTRKNEKQPLKKKIVFALFPKVRITISSYHDFFDFKYHADEFYIKEHEYFIPFVVTPNPNAENRSYLKDGVLNVIDIGKYRPYKNHFVFVDAIAKLKESGRNNNIKFTILGQASYPEEIEYRDKLMQHIKDLGIEDLITLKNHISYKEMPDLYLQNDVFVLTSLDELASISIIESMSNGVIPISTNANGTASYITEGETGFIFKTNNPDDLADKIAYLNEHREIVPIVGQKGYQEVKSKFVFSNYYEILNGILEKEFSMSLK